MLGTKSVGPWAAAWAVMQHLGEDGYLRLTADAATAPPSELIGGDPCDPRARVRGEPDATLVAFGSVDDALDVFAIGDGLLRRGWYLDRQGPPPSLHATVNAVARDRHGPSSSRISAAAAAEARDQQVTGDAARVRIMRSSQP